LALIDTVKILLDMSPAPPDALLEQLIAQADALILGYLGLSALPPGLDSPRAMLAVVLFNRLGAEGEKKRMEGSVTSFFETVPDIIRLQLRPFRKALAVAWPPAPEVPP